jgi:hypothetical protein
MASIEISRLAKPAVACALWLFASAAAQAERLTCALDQGPTKFYIAKSVDFDLDDSGRVKVVDAIIASTDRPSVFGKVAVDNARRLSVTWEIKNVKADPKEYRFYDAHLFYRVTMQKADGSAVMSIQEATPYTTSTYRSTGQCRPAG